MRLGGKGSSGVDTDRLATSVLGALRYLPPRLWVAPLLSELRRWNPELREGFAADALPEVTLWPRYRVPAELVRHVGRLPRTRGGREVPNGWAAPDAVVACDAWTLVFSVDGDDNTNAERVFQDYVMARQLRPDGQFGLVHVNAAGTRRLRAGVHFRVGGQDAEDVQPEDELAPYLLARAARIDALELQKTSVEQHLAWLNWQSLHRILARLRLDDSADYKTAPAPYQAMAQRVRADAVATLEADSLVAPSFGAIELLAELEIDADAVPLWGDAPTPTPGERPKRGRSAKTEPAKAQEPKAEAAPPPEEPKAEEPKPEEPKAEEPKAEEPTVDEPAGVEDEVEAMAPTAAETAQAAPASAAQTPASAARTPASAESNDSGLLAELAKLAIKPDDIPHFPRPTS